MLIDSVTELSDLYKDDSMCCRMEENECKKENFLASIKKACFDFRLLNFLRHHRNHIQHNFSKFLISLNSNIAHYFFTSPAFCK